MEQAGWADVQIMLMAPAPELSQRLQEAVHAHLGGGRIRVAPDVAGAARLLAEQPADCLVMDATGGGVAPQALCEELQRHEVPRPPLLLLVSDTLEGDARAACLEAGADDFLQHPFHELELIAKIRVLVRVRRAEEALRRVNQRLAETVRSRGKELHESEERFRLLFDNVREPVMIWRVGDGGSTADIVAANDAACRLLGYAREELVRKGTRELTPPQRQGRLIRRIESLLQHRKLFFETVLISHDGRQILLGMHAELFESDGETRVMTVCHPLCPAEGDEAEFGKRYHLLAHETGQLVYDVTVDGAPLALQGAVLQLTGYTAAELLEAGSEQWRRLVHPEDRPRVIERLDAAVAAMGKYQMEYRLIDKGGDVRFLEDLGLVMPDDAGAPAHFMGTMKDISARIETEQARRSSEQSQQQAQKLESLGVLAGGIAHDFNNILAAIIGLTDMAASDLPEGSETRTDLEEVLRAANRAKDLVQQILAFSRQTSEQRAPLRLHVVVREVLKLLEASLPRQIRIVSHVDRNSGAVLANATQMHQVVMNYCTNAAQAMRGQGGRLDVALQNMDVTEGTAGTHPQLRPGPYVRLTVSDTGHGMEPGVVERIFDPFFSTKGPGEGTGMGLAVVHGIVSDHGGAIVVESTPGVGSVFHTYLPRVQDEPLQEEPEMELPQSTEERHILVAEDEEAVLRFLDAALRRMGYRVTGCKDGRAALEVFEQAPDAFDLVLTDHMMPEMTGRDLARQINKLRPDLPIVLFTGYMEEWAAHSAEPAIVEVLSKPLSPHKLGEALERALKGE